MIRFFAKEKKIFSKSRPKGLSCAYFTNLCNGLGTALSCLYYRDSFILSPRCLNRTLWKSPFSLWMVFQVILWFRNRFLILKDPIQSKSKLWACTRFKAPSSHQVKHQCAIGPTERKRWGDGTWSVISLSLFPMTLLSSPLQQFPICISPLILAQQWKNPAANPWNPGSIPGSGRSLEKG